VDTGDGLSVLRIKRLVDLVKEIERRRVALLNGEDERQRYERLLSTGQLLHVSHLGLVAGKRYLCTTGRLPNNQSPESH